MLARLTVSIPMLARCPEIFVLVIIGCIVTTSGGFWSISCVSPIPSRTDHRRGEVLLSLLLLKGWIHRLTSHCRVRWGLVRVIGLQRCRTRTESTLCRGWPSSSHCFSTAVVSRVGVRWSCITICMRHVVGLVGQPAIELYSAKRTALSGS